MERIAALSTGTKLTLASGALLFVDLFFTWQTLPQRFGKKFEVTESLDGFDRWGLVLVLLILGLLALVVVLETDAELSPDVPWRLLTLGLASLVFVVTVLKNVTDPHSAWASYVGLVLAALTVVGTYLDRNLERPEPSPARRPPEWRTRVRASSAPAPQGRSDGPAPAEPDPHAAEPSQRW